MELGKGKEADVGGLGGVRLEGHVDETPVPRR